MYENGKPAVEFDGVGDGFSLSSAVGSSVVKYAFTTHSVNSSDTSWSLFTDNNNSAVVPIGQSGSSSAAAFGFTITNFYKDGVSLSISSRDDVYQSYKLGEQSLTTLHLGTDGFIQSLFNRIAFLIEGKVQETIIYESDQSSNRKEIESNINKYFDITPESPKPLLLDKVKEDAAAAYSLRKLRSKYNGPAARVRRDSDNVEVDVYFDSNGEVSLSSRVTNATETTSGSSQSDATFTLNTQTFGEFVGDAAYASGGARSAFVVCWYDQSHEGNDATQNTAANQPKLYDSTDGLVAENGKPAVAFSNTTGSMSGYTPANGDISFFMACLLYTSPSPRDGLLSRMPSSA